MAPRGEDQPQAAASGEDEHLTPTGPGAQPTMSPLQVDDALRTRQLTRLYRGRSIKTVEVEICVTESPTTYSSLTTLVVNLPRGIDSIVLYYPTLMEGPAVLERTPVTYENLRRLGVRNGVAAQEEEGRGTRITLTPEAAEDLPRRLAIDLDAAYVKQVKSGMFDTWHLALGLEVPGAEAILVGLSHPADIALRCRIDNSEYHSLAQGVGAETVRKLGFFPEGKAFLAYTYGSADERYFMSLARWPFAAAFGLIADGLTLAFAKVDHYDLASAALTIALLPPLAQLAMTRRTRYGSADIHERQPHRWLVFGPVLPYVVLTSLACLAITDWTASTDVVQALCYLSAVLNILLGAGVLTAVKQQAIPEHFCDGCGNRIVLRRQSALHRASRRTLCRRCFEEGAPNAGPIAG